VKTARFWVWVGVIGLAEMASWAGHGSAAAAEAALNKPTITRYKGNPIIRPEMISGTDKGAPAGWNIDFPSLIKAPAWLSNPLGKYYLYFSSHHGTYIRMAYADRLEGPWKIHGPGTLTLKAVYAVNGIGGDPNGHCASPDVHVDDAAKQIRMYFHTRGAVGHRTWVALSADGLNFTPIKGALGGPYFRVFRWKGNYYAIDRDASILRSKDGLAGFEEASNALALAANAPHVKGKKAKGKGKDDEGDEGTPGAVRHTGVMLEGDLLTIFYSRTGDAPESILMTQIRLNDDPKTWKAATPILAMTSEMDYEGVKLPIVKSQGGTVIKTRQAREGQTGEAHALRDPFIYGEAGKRYLFYAVAGEHGIGLAELIP
jgi:hypothetical protein